MTPDCKSFAEFWPFYLREHAKPRTRALHYAGTSLVAALALAALVTGNWLLLIAMPVAGYGFAWASHMLVERNPRRRSPTRPGRWPPTSRCGGCG